MEGSSGMFKIEKLTESNYHVWRQKIELILAFREIDHLIEVGRPSEQVDSEKWTKDDAKARAIIGLTLSDEHLEHIRDCTTASEMWSTITDLFQRKTLLNKLACRRKFYSAKMSDGEKAITFISRVRQLAADCRAMGVAIDDQEIAMTVLCGLPQKYEHLIVAIDAAANDDTLSLDFVKSRLLQEEQRILDRGDYKPSQDAALVNTRRPPTCYFCGKKGHIEQNCWQKFPNLRPKQSENKNSGLYARSSERDKQDSDNEDVVCLVARSIPKVARASAALWIIDSGATTHICNDKDMFSALKEIEPIDISIGDKSDVQAIGKGSVNLTLSVRGRSVKCSLNEVLYSPKMGYNLLSVASMSRHGYQTVFGRIECHIEHNGHIIAEGYMKNGLYCLTTSGQKPEPNNEMACVSDDIGLWHRRMAHVNSEGIKEMVRKGVVRGIKVNSKSEKVKCESCVYGKCTRAAAPKTGGTRAKNVLDLVHTDVCGPFPVPSIGGSLYFVTFIDDRSRYAWVYPLKNKSEVFSTFKKWLAMVENRESKKLKVLQWSKRLKTLQSDNGGEYLSKEMTQFLEDRGIQHRLTTPYNPFQNGVAERLNRTLCDLVRTMLHEMNLPKKFWAEAVSVATHVRNRVTGKTLGPNITPYEVMFNCKPNLSYLREFGCKCFYHVRKELTDKLDERARQAIMIGYARGIRGYKLWDIVEEKVVVSRDVRFHEGEIADVEDATDIPSDVGTTTVRSWKQDGMQQGGIMTERIAKIGGPTQREGTHNELLSENKNDFDNDESGNGQGKNIDDGHDQEITDTDDTELRRSTRRRGPPGKWWTAAMALISALPTPDPVTYNDAISCTEKGEWKESMKSEYESLVENKCWKLVPRPKDKNVITCKWVYKTKEEQTTEGRLGHRRKSRVVARGFNQIEGDDYSETFAPVVKFTSIRVILALVTIFNLILHQMDVKTAFLNGDSKEEVYMEQIQGFENGDPRLIVYKMLKAIYGLKQAPRQWFEKIDNFFIDEMGMSRNPADECVYMKRNNDEVLIVALYVDDILVACSNYDILKETKLMLCQKFKMKDLGESKIILGMDIQRDVKNRTLSLCQSRYAEKVVKRFGVESVHQSRTPLDPDTDLNTPSEHCFEPFREAIGSLMYLMVGTRPDLAYAVGRLSKYVEKPTQVHWDAVRRVLRYVLRTKELGLLFKREEKMSAPLFFVDSDWAGDSQSRKSMSGYIVMMGGSAVSWCARQQEVVAMSSAEAEYISLCSCVKEAFWLRRLWKGLGIVAGINEPSIVHVDNQAAISIANTHAVNRRNKHIDVRYHFNREAVKNGVIQLKYCPTNEMVADMLTKALRKTKLENFVEMSE